MTRNKIYMIVQTALIALLAAWLCAAAVGIYLEGAPIRAGEDLFYPIYTRERISARLSPIAPLFFTVVGTSVAGWLMGVGYDAAPSLNRTVVSRPVPGRGTRLARTVLLLLAAALTLAGIFNGGFTQALQKATSICTECIGLG